MNNTIYPLKFDPIYQYRLWGGRKLEHLLSKPIPAKEPIGEAWLLSDREDHANKVTNGELKGMTITKLMLDFRYEIMGKLGYRFEQFPLLLKFLDCKEVLSVQVHPSDHHTEFLSKGDTGKTEAWVVMEANKDSKIYAGLKKGTTKENLRKSIEDKSVADFLHDFIPLKNDAILIPAGTVHTLENTVVFEVQQNSDVTFRLYDWDRIDKKTGKHRELQIDNAIACIDFEQINLEPLRAKNNDVNKNGEVLIDDSHFTVQRICSKEILSVGYKDMPVVLVCMDGSGVVSYNAKEYPLIKGEVMLLPAIIGLLELQPDEEIDLLQITIPEKEQN